MKKFLTVLLVVSVMFTFSFSSAFAATTYTVEDYLKAYTEQLEDSMDLLKSLKKQAAKLPEYDEDGFTADGAGNKYAKAAIEAAFDAYIADWEDAAEDAIDEAIEVAFAADDETTTKPGTLDALVVALDAEGLRDAAWAANQADANEANAPIVKKFVEAEAAEIDPADYSDKEADRDAYGSYSDITPREYVESLLADFAKELKDAEKTLDAEEVELFNAYFDALETLTDAVEAVATLEDAEIADKEDAKDVAGAVNAFMDAAYDFYEANAFVTGGEAYEDGLFADFYDEDAKTLFGVKVKDFDDLTKKEASALNDALYDIIRAAEDIVEEACDTVAEVEALEADIVKTLYNTTKVAEVIEKVEAQGEKMKAATLFGEAVYDAKAVDAAVEAAKELVYDDLGEDEFDSAIEYIWEAAWEEDLTLTLDNGEYAKFLEYREELIEKMITGVDPTTSVKYGSEKTPAEDYVYLLESYWDATCDEKYADAWYEIVEDTIAALYEAQSYEEMDEIMADAAADFAELTPVDEIEDLEEAIAKYVDALEDHAAEAWDLAEQKDYEDYNNGFEAALEEAKDLIEEATSVAEAKAAYAEAKGLFDKVLTDDEIDAAAKEVKAAINALPYTAKLTAADVDAVVAVAEKYADYEDIIGSYELSEKRTLDSKLEKVLEEKYDELEEAYEDFFEDLDDINLESDAGIDEFLATKAAAEELMEAIEAYNDIVDEYGVGEVFEADALEYLLALDCDYVYDQDGINYWTMEIVDAAMLIRQASMSDATVAEMQAAKAAYKALTEKQQLCLSDEMFWDEIGYGFLDGIGKDMLEVIDARLAKTVETLKITASSTAKKGSITVKWTVKGDTSAVEAYEIWRSTKHSSGYKKAFTTTKMSYKNTKGLEKGTRYYYKVRAIAYDMDGDKIKSDWSNKARRIAK